MMQKMLNMRTIKFRFGRKTDGNFRLRFALFGYFLYLVFGSKNLADYQ